MQNDKTTSFTLWRQRRRHLGGVVYTRSTDTDSGNNNNNNKKQQQPKGLHKTG
jgi:hypothetical protein